MLSLKQISLVSAIATANIFAVAHANTSMVPGSSHITWNKSASGDLTDISLTDRTGAIVFIRPSSNNNPSSDSSVNIALNGRFLTSLQDGHYSLGVVCAGDVQLSAAPTAAKINDLTAGAATIQLKPGETQYFIVGTEANFTPVLQQVSAQQAAQTLQSHSTYKQNHQISRVTANDCPAPVQVTPPPVVPAVVTPPPANDYYVETRPNVRLNILFDFDRSDIKPQYQSEIKKAADFLAQYPDAMVIVEGHTDSKGSDAYNQGLSERRAQAVRNALIRNHGIAVSRITAQGYGESRPVATNDTADGRQQNRRVMVVIPNDAQ